MYQSDLNTEEVNRLIRHRRTIKPEQYDQNRTVDQSIIDQMLANANWAPTHGLTEPWRFTVFAGNGLQKLGTFQAEQYKKLVAADQFKEKKYDQLKTRPERSSHVIAIGMKRQESGKIPEVEEIEAVACAVQNMYLTASAYGVGAYWTTGGITYFEEVKPFFNLGAEDRLLGFLYIGYPAIEWPVSNRTDIEQKVRWITEH